MQSRISNTLRPVAFVGGLALLVLALSWLFGSIRPNPANEITVTPTAFTTLEGGGLPVENPDPNATATPTPAENIATDNSPTPTAIPPTAEIPSSGFSSMPNVTFSFANALPNSPDQVSLYQQHPEGTLTEDSVRQMAQQMGLNGQITSSPGEGGDTVYNVTDGDIQMIFYGFPDQFSYFVSTSTVPPLADPLPFDERVAIAEDFLNAYGLLNYPYRAEPSETDPDGVRFVELLDGIPLVYGIGKNPGLIERINISIDPTGQISSLFHSRHNYQSLDTYPLLTAEQAWARLAQPNADSRTRYAVLAAPMSWTREGTEPTELITGYLNNENGGTTFYADDGRIFSLLDTPADLPLYPGLEILGTVTDSGLDWSNIELYDFGYNSTLSCGGGGGGGGGYTPDANFGGGNFSMITLDSNARGNIPDHPTPIQLGDMLDGFQGVLNITHHIFLDGTETNQYNFWFSDEYRMGWTAVLEGDVILGTESLQNLPIIVWGTVTRLDKFGNPVITVNRYEETYPGTRIQAWQGTQQIVTLEGQEVVVFTSQDGSQFVSNNSIRWGAESGLMGDQADTMIIEGYLIPEKTFAGYPVLVELMGGLSDGQTSIDDYVIQSTLIGIQDDTYGSPNPGLTLTGHVTIENVELMYSAVTLTTCTPEFVGNPDYTHFLYAEPVWVFTGYFDDGRVFEVQVQALPDEYLR